MVPIVQSFGEGYQFHFDQCRKGCDRPIFANSRTAAVLESLEGLF